MRILFITSPLYDYQADSLLIGLRGILGADCVEVPRKRIMYGEFPSVYGRGFTIWSRPIADIPSWTRQLIDIDVVVYAVCQRQTAVDWKVLVRNTKRAPRVVYVDGSDGSNIPIEGRPLFKRELYRDGIDVFPIGFGIPDWLIRPLDVSQKTQLHQTHVPDPEFSCDTAYKFEEEQAYYDDLARSFFGLTMKKGGWDCMRHYEILAAGTVVMFREYDAKPPPCSPQCPHFISYSDKNDFFLKAQALVVEGRPTPEYIRILEAQRKWLIENATCTARARIFLAEIERYFSGRPVEAMPIVRFRAVRRIVPELVFLKERMMLRAITAVKRHRFVDWLYYGVLKRMPGVAMFVSRVLMREKANP